MSVYYNEIDPFAAAWLRELMKAGQIPDGEVDERDIRDVLPSDLTGFSQCHFFAGIGGWALALRLAGWPDDRPVWTGSCPCQPFSAAGAGGGGTDERHLWPAWFHLIEGCRPPVLFGEQVEAAIKFGWLDLVCDDLEGIGYAVAPVGLPAASVGANHIRARLWFIADADSDRWKGRSHREIFGAAEETFAWRATRGTPIPHPAYAKRREWTFGGATGRVGREDGITWHGGWETAPEPFLRRGVDGFSGRVDRLRGLGNAIVPPLAAEFIKAYREAIGEDLHGL